MHFEASFVDATRSQLLINCMSAFDAVSAARTEGTGLFAATLAVATLRPR
jgi:hypothetical protein